jgi:D-serine deaminase-like pyridoxal phosphate-dependent protein
MNEPDDLMHYTDLDTPALLIDLDCMENNIRRMAELTRGHNIALRPHTKTHKCPEIAKIQISQGAHGVACAKIGEAEVMVAAGISDILIANEIIGKAKFARLAQLTQKATICVAVDSEFGALTLDHFLSESGVTVAVMVEVNCGHNRCGVLPGEATLQLAEKIRHLQHLHFRGIMSHGGHIYAASGRAAQAKIVAEEVQHMLDTAELLRRHQIAVTAVSVGSSPGAALYCESKGITELRPGNYIFSDLSQVNLKACNLADCALSVLATVTSIPAPNRVVLDAGKKALTSDPLANGDEDTFGLLVDKNVSISRMSEEHGIITAECNCSIGEKVRIIPNHACVVVNMFDQMYGLRNGRVEHVFKITGRGMNDVIGKGGVIDRDTILKKRQKRELACWRQRHRKECKSETAVDLISMGWKGIK